MKIIHCSDLHLDSRMESNLTARQARERNGEICGTFARMMAYARENSVEIVLMAGDMFDTARVSAQTADFVLEQVRKSPSVDFLYLRGNHDENSDPFAGMEIPDNFKNFGDSWEYHYYGNVTVAGLELTRENWDSFYDTLRLPPDTINIAMLHGQVSTQPGVEMIALPKLREKNISYLALGHIHSFQMDRLDPDSCWCYCGCLEGRGFDECGQKGFVLLNVENGGITSEFIPFAERTLWDIPIDITGIDTVSKIIDAMDSASREITEESLVKFTLTGSYTLDTQKDLNFFQKAMAHRFYFVKIKDESRLRIEKESYEHDVSLKGEFIRMVMASDRSAEEKEQIICCGIQALSGEEITL